MARPRALRALPARTAARESFLFAEEAPGPEDEDRAHHRVHDDHGRFRQVEGPPRLGRDDDQPARPRAAHAPQPADDHDDERTDRHADSPAERRRPHARSPPPRPPPPPPPPPPPTPAHP